MGKKKTTPSEAPVVANESMAQYKSSGGFNPGLLSFSRATGGNSGFAPREFSGLVSLIKSGITRKSLDELLEVTGLTLHEIASFMHLNERTLRNYSPGTLLAPEPSERAIEIAFLYEKGKEVFGSLDAFRVYVDSPIPALGMKKPKEFFDTSVGIHFLMDELGRIQHGVFG
jgi:putative toxin-antitoxin system antitoxin component (TIGR02293 family)